MSTGVQNSDVLSGSMKRPIETPVAGLEIGTPASIKARLAPETVAIEEEPSDAVTSEPIAKG
eukprot:CAMPEP_0171499216 /NCGR_PEP_ID=MMETSP0958-20121227/8307_1 /TAXON_ID=87120 /ORGANISM="Aurantiochytrium limacinum, Strain ATCCMYA-1381" /LENGTH=61 /DNA_ID=CAMNT_0012033751 /DNA_START=438 /DNA_END=623 /DNA_ORIENTATION=+